MLVQYQREQRRRQGNKVHQNSGSLVNTMRDTSEGEEEGLESGDNVSEVSEEARKNLSEGVEER